jgi:hypothetical protein
LLHRSNIVCLGQAGKYRDYPFLEGNSTVNVKKLIGFQTTIRRQLMLENRRALRFECEETLVCKSAGNEFKATVMDISRGGMRVRTKKRIEVGSRLVLRLEDRARGRAPVEAVVRWVRLGDELQMGLEFEDSASKLSRRWVRKLFPGAGAAWTASRQQRSEIRAKARLPVVSTNGSVEGATLDVSRSGACIELSGKLEENAGVVLCLPWSYLELNADVLRVEQRRDKWIHSVKLADLNEEQQQQLDAFVEDRTMAMAFEQHSNLSDNWQSLTE